MMRWAEAGTIRVVGVVGFRLLLERGVWAWWVGFVVGCWGGWWVGFVVGGWGGVLGCWVLLLGVGGGFRVGFVIGVGCWGLGWWVLLLGVGGGLVLS